MAPGVLCLCRELPSPLTPLKSLVDQAQECGNGFANSLFFPQGGKAFCTECYEVMIGT